MSVESSPVRNLSLVLSRSNLTDQELLYIADAIYLAECGPQHVKAVQCFQRHNKAPRLSGALFRALEQRNIDAETGTKVVTQTIDLLA